LPTRVAATLSPGPWPAAQPVGRAHMVRGENTLMTPSTQVLLRRLAEKYIWWQTPDEAALMPERVAAQVMKAPRPRRRAGSRGSSRRRVSAGGPPPGGGQPVRRAVLDVLALSARSRGARSGAAIAGASNGVMGRLQPRLDVLPAAQRALWHELQNVEGGAGYSTEAPRSPCVSGIVRRSISTSSTTGRLTAGVWRSLPPDGTIDRGTSRASDIWSTRSGVPAIREHRPRGHPRRVASGRVAAGGHCARRRRSSRAPRAGVDPASTLKHE
jgi:hypothetical protein